jgi:hypothetical protein
MLEVKIPEGIVSMSSALAASHSFSKYQKIPTVTSK